MNLKEVHEKYKDFLFLNEKREDVKFTNLDDFIKSHERKCAEFLFDMDSFSEEELNIICKDYFFYPNPTGWTDTFLQDINGDYVYESLNDVPPPDEIVKAIQRKHGMLIKQFFKKEHYHEIYVYILITPNNADLIISEMNSKGYFVGHISKLFYIDRFYLQIQFEPKDQLDVTDIIKNENRELFHWTPSYHYIDIVKDGLVPRHENKEFYYPQRIYLMEAKTTEDEKDSLGRSLCYVNTDKRNNGEYFLLKVDLNNLDETIRFYYDCNSSVGVFTKHSIPNNHISLVRKMIFQTKF